MISDRLSLSKLRKRRTRHSNCYEITINLNFCFLCVWLCTPGSEMRGLGSLERIQCWATLCKSPRQSIPVCLSLWKEKRFPNIAANGVNSSQVAKTTWHLLLTRQIGSATTATDKVTLVSLTCLLEKHPEIRARARCWLIGHLSCHHILHYMSGNPPLT